MPRAASLQHTIVRTRDVEATARLLSRVAGLRIGERWRNFLPVATKNGVALDLLQVGNGRGGGGDPASPSSRAIIAPQHYAFLTDDAGFDAGLTSALTGLPVLRAKYPPSPSCVMNCVTTVLGDLHHARPACPPRQVPPLAVTCRAVREPEGVGGRVT